MADSAETVFQLFMREKTLGVSWDLTKNRNHKLIASFIWNRAATLFKPGSGLTTASAIKTRVGKELEQVRQYLKLKMGDDEKSGTLTGGSDPIAPAHID